jgi:hypothetical protein
MGISVSVALLRKLCCVLVENVENPEAELFGELGTGEHSDKVCAAQREDADFFFAISAAKTLDPQTEGQGHLLGKFIAVTAESSVTLSARAYPKASAISAARSQGWPLRSTTLKWVFWKTNAIAVMILLRYKRIDQQQNTGGRAVSIRATR